MISTVDVTPQDLGLDCKFSTWRVSQYELLIDTIDAPTRFSGHQAGCGVGKSVVMVSHALLTGSRTLILTPYTGLQDQMGAEFSGLVSDLRGKANYHCRMLQTNCELGSPRCEVRNSVMGAGLCQHKAAIGRASRAQIVVSNYACWLHQNTYTSGLGDFDTLILDEADQAVESSLSSFLAFSLSSREVMIDCGGGKNSPHWNDTTRMWSEWAAIVVKKLRAITAQAEQEAKESDRREVLERFFHLRNLTKKLTTLSELVVDEWVSEPTRDGIKFDPIWPGKFAEKYIFRGIKRVIEFGGTLNRKAFELQGVRNDDYTFYEYDSPFHPARSPLILLPIGNFKYPIKAELMNKAVDCFDSLVDLRMNSKGILHTVSFDHLNDFVERSRHSDLFLSNDIKYAGGMRRTGQVVDDFKAASPPAILASPSIVSGYDFPDAACRYQLLLKVPFPDTQSAVAKERRKLDPEYHDNIAMTSLIQISSRACRSNFDWSETYILDTRIGWFLMRNRHLAAKWFLGARGSGRYRKLNEGVIPGPIYQEE